MTWTTSHGAKVEHPWQASGKQPKDWDERDKQWVQKYTHLHEQAMRMDMELVGLRAENLRLKTTLHHSCHVEPMENTK
jgi:hypothetical protein